MGKNDHSKTCLELRKRHQYTPTRSQGAKLCPLKTLTPKRIQHQVPHVPQIMNVFFAWRTASFLSHLSLQHHTDGVDERLEDRVDGQYQNDQGRIGVSGKLDSVGGQKAHQVHWKPAQEVPDGDRNQALGNGPIGGFQHASRRPEGFSFQTQ